MRNKKETLYCYTEAERDSGIKQLGGQSEVTRFKGLGEISQAEFAQFIGEDIRLLPVSVQSLKKVPGILEFYMGKNTPARREFIMKNLLAEVDA